MAGVAESKLKLRTSLVPLAEEGEVMFIRKYYANSLIIAGVLAIAILILSVLSTTMNGSTKKSKTILDQSSPAIVFTIDLAWPELYEGDPLRIEGRLISPRDRQEIIEQMKALEKGIKPAQTELTLPEIAVDWASTVKLTLYKIDSNGTKQGIISGNLSEYLVGKDESNNIPSFPLQAVAMEEWLIPADKAKLIQGTYQLQAIWNGKGKVDQSIIGPKGKLKAESLTFTVSTVGNAYQSGEHAYRLALSAYASKDYENAKRYGQESLTHFTNELNQEAMDSYFIVGNSQLGLQDYQGALTTYKQLLDKMPDKDSDLAALVTARIKNLERLIVAME